jgi:hypothetical protein
MRNYSVRPLRQAARRHGTAWLSPLLKDLMLCMWGVALFHQHRPAPAGHTSNRSTAVARVVRPGSWVHDGSSLGGLRWSTRIAPTMSGELAASSDAGVLSRERHVVSRRWVPRTPRATGCLRHRCSSPLIQAATACTLRVRSATTPRVMRFQAWLRTNVRQRYDGRRWPGARLRCLGRYLRTVRGETRRPSLSCSSLAIRR